MQWKGWMSILLLAACRLPAAEIQAEIKPGELRWSFQGRTILVYRYDSAQFKPYVQQLYTLSGVNVLRDAPADHLHHHGMMYAVRVNGVNFWEENEKPGYQKPVHLTDHRTGTDARGHPAASFTQTIHWLREEDRRATNSESLALLIENRTLTLTLDQKAGEVALQWSATFQVGNRDVVVDGTRYNGLGMRFPESFDKCAQLHTVGPNMAAKRTEQIVPADWLAVTGTHREQEATLALFVAPENAGESRFFVMTEPFAYLSATQQLDKKPMAHRAGEIFELSYLVVLYPGARTTDGLQSRYEHWHRR